jgi:hypothetical protein
MSGPRARRVGAQTFFAALAMLCLGAWFYLHRQYVLFGVDGNALSVLRTVIIAVGVLATYIAVAETAGLARTACVVAACAPLAAAWLAGWHWERQKSTDLARYGLTTEGVVVEGWLIGRGGRRLRYRVQYEAGHRSFRTRSQVARPHEINLGDKVRVVYSERDPRLAEIRP